MKTIQKIVLITILTAFQFCKSQDAQKYAVEYNKVVPKLQILASEKQKFYNQNFSDLLSEFDKKNIKIYNYTFFGKADTSEKVYIMRLMLYNRNDFDKAINTGYQIPIMQIFFEDQIPDEIKTLTRKYEGKLTPEVRDFLANRKIEKIEFYGINGLKSTDRSVR